ncbi:MAG: hypothetical protein ACTHOK_02415 [Nocardioidaceae bacterium]
MHIAIHTQQRLLDTAQRLAGEFDSLPAGSVLRCYSRATRGALRAGVGLPDLPGAAEQRARRVLESRAA